MTREQVKEGKEIIDAIDRHEKWKKHVDGSVRIRFVTSTGETREFSLAADNDSRMQHSLSIVKDMISTSIAMDITTLEKMLADL